MATDSQLSFPLPNLYRRERIGVAERLYPGLVSHLVFEDRYAEAVVAVRRIRSFAHRSLPAGSPRYSFFSWEIEALVSLKKPMAAWRQYRLSLRKNPKRARLTTLEGRVRTEPSTVLYTEVPLLYATGRWKQGCNALEAYLHNALVRNRHITAYDLMVSVYNQDATGPTLFVRATLSHFYSKLGKGLEQWRDWGRWVRALHPGLFRLTGLTRSALLADPALLAKFYNRLSKERQRRSGSSGVSYGQQDLVEGRAKVEKRHKTVRKRREKWSRAPSALRDELRSKQRRYFPSIYGD